MKIVNTFIKSHYHTDFKTEIEKHFRLMYGINLNQAQLDDINDFYHQSRKSALKDLIIYRFINMMLGIVFLIGSMLFVVDPWSKNLFFIAVWTFFVFYNKIHGIINWVQYKRVKQPSRPSDE